MVNRFLLAAMAIVGVSASAQADPIIFNGLGTKTPFNTVRSAGNAPIGLVTFSAVTTISAIGVYDAMATAGTQTFLIFNYATRTLLYQSAAKAFEGDGGTAVGLDSYKVSDALSFTFQPGITYEIGATASVSTGYYVAYDAVTQNGITMGSNNDNVTGTTAQGISACCSTGIELFGSIAATSVPEPATLILLGGAVLGAGVARRKDRRPQA